MVSYSTPQNFNHTRSKQLKELRIINVMVYQFISAKSHNKRKDFEQRSIESVKQIYSTTLNLLSGFPLDGLYWSQINIASFANFKMTITIAQQENYGRIPQYLSIIFLVHHIIRYHEAANHDDVHIQIINVSYGSK